MSAVCTRCQRENADHPFAVPGPPFTPIEVALMDAHYLSDHDEKVQR